MTEASVKEAMAKTNTSTLISCQQFELDDVVQNKHKGRGVRRMVCKDIPLES